MTEECSCIKSAQGSVQVGIVDQRNCSWFNEVFIFIEEMPLSGKGISARTVRVCVSSKKIRVLERDMVHMLLVCPF